MSDAVNSCGWIRYRFMTGADDYRPIVFNPRFPWWLSGSSGDMSIIVAYLPSGEPLQKYWDDATDVDSSAVPGIVFSDRFRMPSYFMESKDGDDLLSTEVRP